VTREYHILECAGHPRAVQIELGDRIPSPQTHGRGDALPGEGIRGHGPAHRPASAAGFEPTQEKIGRLEFLRDPRRQQFAAGELWQDGQQ
jgi:hypothetical protein